MQTYFNYGLDMAGMFWSLHTQGTDTEESGVRGWGGGGGGAEFTI
jgi:hypothetical protein